MLSLTALLQVKTHTLLSILFKIKPQDRFLLHELCRVPIIIYIMYMGVGFNQFNHISLVAVVAPTDRPKSVLNRCVIEVFDGIFVLSRCLLEFSVGVGFLS